MERSSYQGGSLSIKASKVPTNGCVGDIGKKPSVNTELNAKPKRSDASKEKWYQNVPTPTRENTNKNHINPTPTQTNKNDQPARRTNLAGPPTT